MADYFPLISRAVLALPKTGTREQRDAIYERAREALTRQLRSIEPALAPDHIESEILQLENAVMRLEAQLAQETADALNPQVEPAITMQRPQGRSSSAAETRLQAPPEIERQGDPSSDIPAPERPKVPFAERDLISPRKSRNLGVILAAGLPIIVGVAAAAYILRDNPDDFLKSKRNTTIVQPEGKSASANPSDEKAGGGATSPVQPSEPVIPVAVRASLYEEAAGSTQRLERRGAIIWRLEPDVVERGAAAAMRIRAEIEIPEANLSVEFIVRRNLDQSFPASHTFNIRFIPNSDSAQGVKTLELPEFREDPVQRGPALQGVKAPLQDNTFLVALLNGEPVQSTNIDLLKRPGWLFFELRFADGRRGELIFEKGVAGERAFNEAFSAWEQ